MNNLNCSVYSCQSNKQNNCCRSDISVTGGENVSTATDTMCSSYCPSSSSNAMDYSTPNPSLNISCNVSSCCHNKSSHCTSNSVDIREGSKGSECCTFQK